MAKKESLVVDIGLSRVTKDTERRLIDFLRFPKNFAVQLSTNLAVASWAFNQITQAVTKVTDVWFAHKRQMIQDMADLRREMEKFEGVRPGAAPLTMTQKLATLGIARTTGVRGGAETVTKIFTEMQEFSGLKDIDPKWVKSTAEMMYAVGPRLDRVSAGKLTTQLREFRLSPERARDIGTATVKGILGQQSAHALALSEVLPVGRKSVAGSGEDQLTDLLSAYAIGPSEKYPIPRWKTSMLAFMRQASKKENIIESALGDRGLINERGQIVSMMGMANAIRRADPRAIRTLRDRIPKRAGLWPMLVAGIDDETAPGREPGEAASVWNAYRESLGAPESVYLESRAKMDASPDVTIRREDEKKKIDRQRAELFNTPYASAYSKYQTWVASYHRENPGRAAARFGAVSIAGYQRPWEGTSTDRNFIIFAAMKGLYTQIEAEGQRIGMSKQDVSQMQNVASVLDIHGNYEVARKYSASVWAARKYGLSRQVLETLEGPERGKMAHKQAFPTQYDIEPENARLQEAAMREAMDEGPEGHYGGTDLGHRATRDAYINTVVNNYDKPTGTAVDEMRSAPATSGIFWDEGH